MCADSSDAFLYDQIFPDVCSNPFFKLVFRKIVSPIDYDFRESLHFDKPINNCSFNTEDFLKFSHCVQKFFSSKLFRISPSVRIIALRCVVYCQRVYLVIKQSAFLWK